MSTAASAGPTLPNSTVRSYALIGIVLYAFGFVLNGIGNSLSQYWLVPYADTVTALGFVVALYTATLAGISTRTVVLIGLLYGVGTFYLGEPHSTHIASGLGFGLEHMTHIDIGLGLVTTATVLLVALAYYKTRTKPALPA
jgi:hypothetical protein